MSFDSEKWTVEWNQILKNKVSCYETHLKEQERTESDRLNVGSRRESLLYGTKM